MVKFAVCVEMIFNYLPFLERLEKVKEVGVSAFEFWDWTKRNVNAIAEKKEKLGLSVSSFNVCPRISSLTSPDVKEEFVSSIEESIRIAKKLDCNNLIGPVGLGRYVRGLTRQEQIKNAVENLKAVVPLLEESGITLLIEPVNPINHKGLFLRKSAEAAKIISEVGSSAVKILYDFYHQQLTEGNLINNAKRYFDLSFPAIEHGILHFVE